MPAVCDCFPELKSVTAAREARYRSDPGKPAPEGPQSSLEIKVTSIGNLNERVETRNSGRHFIISEPKHVGGIADAPTPLEFLLSGAVGCYASLIANSEWLFKPCASLRRAFRAAAGGACVRPVWSWRVAWPAARRGAPGTSGTGNDSCR